MPPCTHRSWVLLAHGLCCRSPPPSVDHGAGGSAAGSVAPVDPQCAGSTGAWPAETVPGGGAVSVPANVCGARRTPP